MSGDQHNQADPLDLDAIEARAGGARPGPWAAAEGASGDRWWIEKTNTATIAWVDREYAGPAEAAFIAHAREDVPALVAEVRRLRDKVADAAGEAVAIAATAVRSQGETDPDVADSTLRSLSRRTKALADGLRE